MKENIKRISLRIPLDIYNRLLAEQNAYSYPSIQQVILDALRQKCYTGNVEPSLVPSIKKKSNAGRPKNYDLASVMTKKAFTG